MSTAEDKYILICNFPIKCVCVDTHYDFEWHIWLLFCLGSWMKASEVKVNELEFNAQFVSRMIPKLEWSALIQAAEWVSEDPLDVISMIFNKEGEFVQLSSKYWKQEVFVCAWYVSADINMSPIGGLRDTHEVFLTAWTASRPAQHSHTRLWKWWGVPA